MTVQQTENTAELLSLAVKKKKKKKAQVLPTPV